MRQVINKFTDNPNFTEICSKEKLEISMNLKWNSMCIELEYFFKIYYTLSYTF